MLTKRIRTRLFQTLQISTISLNLKVLVYRLQKRKLGKKVKRKCNNFPPTKSYPRHISLPTSETNKKKRRTARIQRRGEEIQNGPAPALSPPPSTTASPGPSCADPGEPPPPPHSVAPAPFPSVPAPPPPSPGMPATRARVRTRAQLGHSQSVSQSHSDTAPQEGTESTVPRSRSLPSCSPAPSSTAAPAPAADVGLPQCFRCARRCLALGCPLGYWYPHAWHRTPSPPAPAPAPARETTTPRRHISRTSGTKR